MKLIKSASVYKATVPSAELLRTHFAEKPFTEMQPYDARSVGFVPRESGDLVTEFAGGIAFQVRIDEKIVPGSVVTAEVDKEIKKIRDNEGRKVGKKEKAEIKDGVIAHLRAKALTKTAIITCFHHNETEYLIIPTTSRNICDTITTAVINAVGSVKTQTIHVSEVKHGLTTRLMTWLDGENEFSDEAFGKYHPHGTVALSCGSQKLSVKMDSLQMAREGLQEAVKKGFGVTSIGLQADAMEYRLTHDFKFTSIEFPAPDDGEVIEDLWLHEAALQVLNLTAVVTDLCEMFAYKEPEADETAEAAE